ncbi:hypothetical protein DFP72DRAFT_1049203 [Ephemerocybe angulata]|uniref:DUF6533 domain-containing protein n=1 Tax=Ephemerocybe angulata TaxID=980116 RepID=A0A8H6HLB1_9AGAR|nr:hypothetical protein DFP72DRAFT_1049203 [Tulosesus angulatus]
MVTATPKQLTASAWTLVIYDYLLTFETEVATIWPSPWSIGLPLFYLNRYFPLIDQALLIYFDRSTDSAGTCEGIYTTAIWMGFVGSAACRIIIYLHTCALWGRSRTIVFLLGGFLLALFSVWVIFGVLQSANMTCERRIWKAEDGTDLSTDLGVFDQPLATTPGCRKGSRAAYWQLIYSAALTMEAVTVGCMVVRGLQHVQQSRDSWVLTLYWNGILHCVVLTLLGIINIVMMSVPAMVTAAVVLAPTETPRNFNDTEESGVTSSRGVLTSIEEYPRHELQTSGKGLWGSSGRHSPP